MNSKHIIFGIGIIIVIIFFLSGCNVMKELAQTPTTAATVQIYVCPDGSRVNDTSLCKQEAKTTEIVCNKPYMRFGTSCCLDKNDNQVCDNDETEVKQTVTSQPPTNQPAQLSDSEIIEKSLLKTVLINITQAGKTMLIGSGFFVSQDGYVITNYHVVSGYINETYPDIIITTKDGKSYSANKYTKTISIIAYSPDYDIALLKKNTNQMFNYFEFADSSLASTGDIVYALGSPMGLDFSASRGIISARDRNGLKDNGEFNEKIKGYFQTDAAINPGNSGGSLINTEGKVVGLNSFGYIYLQGLKFALESNKVKDFFDGSKQILCVNTEKTCVTTGKYYETCYPINTCLSGSKPQANQKVTVYSFEPSYNLISSYTNPQVTFDSFTIKVEDNPKINTNKETNNVCFNFKAIKDGFVKMNKELDTKIVITPNVIKSIDPIKVGYAEEGHGDYYFEVTAYNCETKNQYGVFYLRKWI